MRTQSRQLQLKMIEKHPSKLGLRNIMINKNFNREFDKKLMAEAIKSYSRA